MTIDIASALRAYSSAPKPTGIEGGDDAGGGFGAALAGVLDDAMKSTKAGEQAMAASASGKAELVDVVTAVSNAETSLETVIALRDRMISAYQDIMRMPV
jgi:flagellar hook-basal body complex protein FliE